MVISEFCLRRGNLNGHEPSATSSASFELRGRSLKLEPELALDLNPLMVCLIPPLYEPQLGRMERKGFRDTGERMKSTAGVLKIQ